MDSRLTIQVIIAFALAGTTVQAQPSAPIQRGPAFTSQTTEVMVPALVQDSAGNVVFTLQANDFLLTDDGVPQKLMLQHETGSEPLALVIVIEVGGAGARQFQKDSRLVPPLAPMLPSLVGHVPHRVALVTFDSHPELVEDFTSDLDAVQTTLRGLSAGCSRQSHYENCSGPNPVHDQPMGDNGAAILDSLKFAVEILQTEPASFRRTILLVSETADRGSETTVEQAVRAITDTNTIVYAIGFSTAKSEAAHYAHHQLPLSQGGWQLAENPRPNPPHGCMGKDPSPRPDDPTSKWSQFYDCVAQLVPPLTFAKMAAIATSDSLRQNVPATVARLTGGVYFKLGSGRHLEQDLMAIGNQVPNRYALSFQPKTPHPGLHVLTLTLPDYAGLKITARTSYWPSPPSLLRRIRFPDHDPNHRRLNPPGGETAFSGQSPASKNRIQRAAISRKTFLSLHEPKTPPGAPGPISWEQTPGRDSPSDSGGARKPALEERGFHVAGARGNFFDRLADCFCRFPCSHGGNSHSAGPVRDFSHRSLRHQIGAASLKAI
jgi:VWFA-related protein